MEDVSKFKIIEVLSKGGIATIYKAYDNEIKTIVALKIIDEENCNTDDIQRFKHEGELTSKLSSPHIVPVYECGKVNKIHYIAMKLIDGENFAAIITKKKLLLEKMLNIFIDVCEAVHYAHQHKLLHLDIKPENIIVDKNLKGYLMDFGLVRETNWLHRKKKERIVVGTPSYMSPEQARGKIYELDKRSDIYGLGALLYEILTQQPPFECLSDFDTLYQVARGEPIPPRKLNPDVHPYLEAICLKCLQKSPFRRYPSAKELKEDILRVINNKKPKCMSFISQINNFLYKLFLKKSNG